MKNKLNQILSIVQKSSEIPQISAGGWFREFFYESYSNKIYIFVENRKYAIDFDKQIDLLWRQNKDIHKNFCKRYFKNHILNLVLIKLETKTNFNDKEWNNIISFFAKIPKIKYEIFKEIKGCIIKSQKPIETNDFIIYSWPKHQKLIKEKYPKAFENQYPSFYDNRETKVLVSVIIEAQTSARAYDLADYKFKRLENILRYLFTESSYLNHGAKIHDIGIFDFRKNDWLETLDLTENAIGGIVLPIGTYRELVLDNKKLNGNKYVKRIWELLDSNTSNKLNTRILNAIEWIGKAKHEIEIDKAFILYFFAIESLLNFDEKGLIAPSLTQQMKEYMSFILGKNKEQRIELDLLFGKLYHIRSAVVHGSAKEITIYDIEDVENLAQKIVQEFLINPKFKNLKSENNFEELKLMIRDMKYTSS